LENESEVIQRQVREYFRKIQIKEPTDIEYVKEQSLDFCRKQNLKKAMMKSVALLQNCSFDEISKTINDALVLGSDNNFGYDYLADFEERFKPKHRNPVTTGWDEMDDITSGGLGRNELGVVIAPTGAGKSMVLVHLGAQALREGKNVIHYTLELQDMRALSNEFNCPVWTASQTNRSGLNAEVVTMESISEAFSKCFVADLIFSVSRTIEDKQANTGRIFVAKNRNGPDGMVYPIFMDTSNVGIKFAPPQPNPVTTPLNPVSLTSAMQSNLLKQKYSKLRKSGSMNK
jgi:hypothetical protein